MTRLLAIAVALALGLGGTARAETYVSGVGDDANPCSRTAPCKTFAGALTQTPAGGVIIALDAGDYGSVTITEAVTIDGSSVEGDFKFAGSEGVTVAAGPNDVVTLRGISINAHGSGGSGTGVSITGAGTVHLDRVFVSGFADGVSFMPSAGAQLYATDVVSKNNSGAGFVAASGAGLAQMTLAGCHGDENGVGIRALAGGRIDVYDSDATQNSVAGVSAELDGNGGSAEINLEHVDAGGNGIGVQATAIAGSAVVRLSQVLAAGDKTLPVLASGGGRLYSFGNNRLDVAPAIALSSAAPSATVTAGGKALYPLDVAVTGLMAAPIVFSCSGLPVGATCTFAPATMWGITTGSDLITIATTSPEGNDGGFVTARLPPLPPMMILALLSAALLLTMARRPSQRRPLGAALAAIAFAVAVTTIAACSSSLGGGGDMGNGGGGGSGGGNHNNHDMSVAAASDMATEDLGPPDLALPYTPTPPGTYMITVTATSGTITATQALTLVVN
jgi:hypothetical protein